MFYWNMANCVMDVRREFRDRIRNYHHGLTSKLFFIIAFASAFSNGDSKYNPSAAVKYGLGLIIRL